MDMMPMGDNQMMYNPQLQEVLKGITEAVKEEKEDELFYDYLANVAPTREEKDILISIRDDERRHNRMFRKIYNDFTGMDVQSNGKDTFEVPKSYMDGLKKGLFGELRAIEKYRAIRSVLPSGPYKEILFEIITDEIRHASKFNYLITLNSSMNLPATNRTTQQDTSKFTPDDWVRYITPLVNRALEEAKEGINPEHLYQEFILSGVLVGLGKTPQEAIVQVEKWENDGTSQLLAKSKMARDSHR